MLLKALRTIGIAGYGLTLREQAKLLPVKTVWKSEFSVS
jgi:hypothetical protein